MRPQDFNLFDAAESGYQRRLEGKVLDHKMCLDWADTWPLLNWIMSEKEDDFAGTDVFCDWNPMWGENPFGHKRIRISCKGRQSKRVGSSIQDLLFERLKDILTMADGRDWLSNADAYMVTLRSGVSRLYDLNFIKDIIYWHLWPLYRRAKSSKGVIMDVGWSDSWDGHEIRVTLDPHSKDKKLMCFLDQEKLDLMSPTPLISWVDVFKINNTKEAYDNRIDIEAIKRQLQRHAPSLNPVLR